MTPRNGQGRPIPPSSRLPNGYRPVYGNGIPTSPNWPTDPVAYNEYVAKEAFESARRAGALAWPDREPSPFAMQPPVGHQLVQNNPDVLPVRLPLGFPAPPVEREDDETILALLSSVDLAFIRRQAIETAKEGARILWNPYLFPSPQHEDYDYYGRVLIVGPAPVASTTIIRFTVPKGYNAIWESFGLAFTPTTVEDFVTVFPQKDGSTLKEFRSGGGSAPMTTGSGYVPGSLTDPRALFQPLQEEQSAQVNISIGAAAPAALFPVTVKAIMRGKFFPIDSAVMHWNYRKSG